MNSVSQTKITAAKDIPNEVSTADMAQVLGISVRQLQRLTREGWVEGHLGHGRYDLKRAVRAYFGYCQMLGRART